MDHQDPATESQENTSQTENDFENLTEKEIADLAIDGLEDDEHDDDFNPLQTYQEIYNVEEEHHQQETHEVTNDLSKHNPDILVIGAGPVGLWTAVQIKLLLPQVNILILDKHLVYVRNHLLRITKSSLKEIHGDKLMNDFRKFAVKLTGKIRTNDLERALWGEAERLGIKKEIMEVKEISKLKQLFPNVKIIIGCDGSHSLVRKNVFNDKLSVKETIEHVVFVKYDAQGKAETLNPMESYAGLKMINHLVYETTGKQVDNQSPVTLQIKIDADAYKTMGDCKFKTPYLLPRDQSKVEPKLLETITVWLNMREKFNKEKRIPDTEKITTVNLDVYRAESVAKYSSEDQVAVFLCGDSACGVPFFRALNNGMLCGSSLASLIKTHYDKIDKAIKKYNKYFDLLANFEIFRAKKIAWAHKVGENAVRFNAKLPWQFISLKKYNSELHQPLQSHPISSKEAETESEKNSFAQNIKNLQQKVQQNIQRDMQNAQQNIQNIQQKVQQNIQWDMQNMQQNIQNLLPDFLSKKVQNKSPN